jgi:hypothetical protein
MNWKPASEETVKARMPDVSPRARMRKESHSARRQLHRTGENIVSPKRVGCFEMSCFMGVPSARGGHSSNTILSSP